jgi:hypothetical protein
VRCERQSFIALLPLLVGIVVSLDAQTVQSLSASFTIRRSEDSGEPVSGMFYQIGANRTILQVTEPVLQWNVFDAGNLLIYYPEAAKAYRFVSRNRLLIPFSYSFIGLVREDFGLANAGFTLQDTRIDGEYFVSTWDPPEPVEAIIGEAVVGMSGEWPVYLEVRGPDGSAVVRVEYSGYQRVGVYSLPSHAHIVRNSDSGVEEEFYDYAGFAVNGVLPDAVLHFSLPDNVDVRELAW